MKIVAAEIQSTRVPVVRPHQMAIGTTTAQEGVFVKLIDEDGIVGYGETPFMVGHSQLGETQQTVRVILRTRLIPAVLGMDALDQEALSRTMDARVPGNDRAKGAVIMAAYDLAGKQIGTSVANLVGGKVRTSVPLSWSLPIVETSAIIEESLKMVEMGFRILKVKIGRPDPLDDVRAVADLRRAVGHEVRIRADANQAYGLKDALRVVRALEEYNVDFVEQPVHRDDLDAMAEVTRQSPVLIMADESAKSPEALAQIARMRAADSVSIYITGPGGLGKSKKMAAIAEAFHMPAYIGGALEGVAGAACGLHLAASSPSVTLGCELSGQFLLTDSLNGTGLEFKEGALVVPEGPGLGIEIDEERLSRYREGEVEAIP